MCTKTSRSIGTLENALGEYKNEGVVSLTKCESCQNLIEIKPKGESVLLVSCKCGLYNDTLRGF
jgi:hypothetical protein